MNAKKPHKDSKKDQNIIKEQPLTYDDYAAIDDDTRYELVAGHLELMSPSPSPKHQLVASEIYKQIDFDCRKDYVALFAPIDVILSPSDVRQPDIVLLSRQRMDILTNRGIEGPPDLMIEIISPSSMKRDKIDKLVTYAYFGIPEYWIVDPHHAALEQHLLNENAYNLIDVFQADEPVKTPTVPCVSFTMNEIMENIPDLG